MRRIGRLLALVSAILTAFVTSAPPPQPPWHSCPARAHLGHSICRPASARRSSRSGERTCWVLREVMFGTTKVPVARVLSTSKVEVKTPPAHVRLDSLCASENGQWVVGRDFARPYSFMAKPVLTAVTPHGAVCRRDFVTLTGSGLRTSLVTFGDQQASVVSQSATAG